VADLGEGDGGKKEESQKEEKAAGQAKHNRAPSLAQGLDPPLTCSTAEENVNLCQSLHFNRWMRKRIIQQDFFQL